MFGSAMDSALNALLESKGEDPMEAFSKTLGEYQLGTVTFSKYDYDGELLDEETRADLLSMLSTFGYKGDDIDGLVSSLMSKPELTENQTRALDTVQRRVFTIKAKLILDKYKTAVLPYISKVYNVQKRSGPGFLDATVEWVNRGKVILDNKTSSRLYPDNAVEYSAQLSMYAAEENISAVAFVVMNKTINKNRIKLCAVCGHRANGSHKSCNNEVDGVRCNGPWNVSISPEAEIQIVHGDITPEQMNVAAELQREVARAVEAKIFPCNVANCNSQYGKPCEYRDLKWKGDMTGLTVYKRKETK